MEGVSGSGVLEVVYQGGDDSGKQFNVGQPRLLNNTSNAFTAVQFTKAAWFWRMKRHVERLCTNDVIDGEFLYISFLNLLIIVKTAFLISNNISNSLNAWFTRGQTNEGQTTS